jgi:hypothetical protein
MGGATDRVRLEPANSLRLGDREGGRKTSVSDEQARSAEKQTVTTTIAVPLALVLGFVTGRWTMSIIVGFGAGCLFGAAMAMLVSRLAHGAPDLFVVTDPIGPEEPVLHEGLANHFRGIEGVGGKLFLTDRRLRFVSHRLNVQVHDTSWPLSTIVRAEATRTLGVIPNGLVVWLADGRRERFVVHGRDRWTEAIGQAQHRAH